MANALYSIKERVKNSLADIKKQPKNALIDATRGALLGATTDVVGYIPDAVADFMRPFGYNVPRDQVVGGTEWLANRFAQPTNSLAENAARFTTGMLTPSPMDFARAGKPVMNELTVYHGSPHRINNVDEAHPMGRFDTSKIGTGEGAQAYGHGIYLAESPDVAQSYQRKLSGILGSSANTISVDGAALNDLTDGQRRAYEIIARDGRKNAFSTAAGLEAEGLDATDLRAALTATKGKKVELAQNPGHFYTVDLPDEHIANMLDWDAPLSEQPEAVRKALRDAGMTSYVDEMESAYFGSIPQDAAALARKMISGPESARTGTKQAERNWRELQRLAPDVDHNAIHDIHDWYASKSGADLYSDLAGHSSDGQAKASERLRSLGIPGIRYLDGGSRSAGNGTRNFVIFDGDTAKILKRE